MGLARPGTGECAWASERREGKDVQGLRGCLRRAGDIGAVEDSMSDAEYTPVLPVRHDRHDRHDAFHGLRHDPRHALHCRGRVVVRGDRIDGKIKDTVWRWV